MQFVNASSLFMRISRVGCHGVYFLGTPGLILLCFSGRKETALLVTCSCMLCSFFGNAWSGSVMPLSKLAPFPDGRGKICWLVLLLVGVGGW